MFIGTDYVRLDFSFETPQRLSSVLSVFFLGRFLVVVAAVGGCVTEEATPPPVPAQSKPWTSAQWPG